MSDDSHEYLFAAKWADVKEQELVEISLRDRSIVLAACGDDVFALEGICTHAHAHLVDGYLTGTTVECPMHGGCFDVKTGEPTAPPCVEPLRTYPVRIQGEDVLVGVPLQG